MSCFKSGNEKEVFDFDSWLCQNYLRGDEWSKNEYGNNPTVMSGIVLFIQNIPLLRSEVNGITNELFKILSSYMNNYKNKLKDEDVSKNIVDFLKNPNEDYFNKMVENSNSLNKNYNFFFEVIENLKSDSKFKLENLQSYFIFMSKAKLFTKTSTLTEVKLNVIDISSFSIERSKNARIINYSDFLSLSINSEEKRIAPLLPNTEGTCYFNAAMIALLPFLKILNSEDQEIGKDEFLTALTFVYNILIWNRTIEYSKLKQAVRTIVSNENIIGASNNLSEKIINNLIAKNVISTGHIATLYIGNEESYENIKCSQDVKFIIVKVGYVKKLESIRIPETDDIRFMLRDESIKRYPLLFEKGGEYYKLKSLYYETPVISSSLKLNKKLGDCEAGHYHLFPTFVLYIKGNKRQELNLSVWNKIIGLLNLSLELKAKFRVNEEDFSYPFSKEKIFYNGATVYYVDEKKRQCVIPVIKEKEGIELFRFHSVAVSFVRGVCVEYDDNRQYPQKVELSEVWKHGIESMTYKKLSDEKREYYKRVSMGETNIPYPCKKH